MLSEFLFVPNAVKLTTFEPNCSLLVFMFLTFEGDYSFYLEICSITVQKEVVRLEKIHI